MKLFEPSSEMLMTMISSAEAKCDADREQHALRKEARAEELACRLWTAQAKQRRFRSLYGPST